MGKLSLAMGTPLDQIPKTTRGITAEDSAAVLAWVMEHGTATASGEDGNRATYETEEDAAKVGRTYKRALEAVAPEGESAKLRVYQRRGDSAFIFDVFLGKAREGKGEARPDLVGKVGRKRAA